VKGRIFKAEIPEEKWIRDSIYPYLMVKRSDGEGYHHVFDYSDDSLNRELAKLLRQILDGVPAKE
jgi:hypothetical protein